MILGDIPGGASDLQEIKAQPGVFLPWTTVVPIPRINKALRLGHCNNNLEQIRFLRGFVPAC
jgi:hypothetical protein